MSTVVLFNKPYGVLCQFSPGAQSARATLREYLPQRDVYPAGRLDADSEGLVVLTADGALQHALTDPRHKLPKTYLVQVEGVPNEDALERLRTGVEFPDYRTRPAQARTVEEPAWVWPRVPPIRTRLHIPTRWLEIVLTEGRNRQVRRMTAAVGFPTLRLIRYSVGDWNISSLGPGAWRVERVTRPAAPAREAPGSGRRRPSTVVRARR